MPVNNNISDTKQVDIKGFALSGVEQEIILVLAGNGPMSGYDFHVGGKRIRKAYHTGGDISKKAIVSSGHWLEVKKRLLKLGLIQSVKKETEIGGRRKDLYWLTDDGVTMAIVLGANILKLKSIHKQTRKLNDDVKILYDFAKFLPRETVAIIHSLNMAYKEGGPERVFGQIVIELRGLVISDKEREMVLEVIKKYPNSITYNMLKEVKRGFVQLPL